MEAREYQAGRGGQESQGDVERILHAPGSGGTGMRTRQPAPQRVLPIMAAVSQRTLRVPIRFCERVFGELRCRHQYWLAYNATSHSPIPHRPAPGSRSPAPTTRRTGATPRERPAAGRGTRGPRAPQRAGGHAPLGRIRIASRLFRVIGPLVHTPGSPVRGVDRAPRMPPVRRARRQTRVDLTVIGKNPGFSAFKLAGCAAPQRTDRRRRRVVGPRTGRRTKDGRRANVDVR